MLSQIQRLSWAAATLVRIVIDVDLNQHLNGFACGALSAESLPDFAAIYGMHPVKVLGDFPGFIGLDVTDVVPGGRNTLQGINFAGGFL